MRTVAHHSPARSCMHAGQKSRGHFTRMCMLRERPALVNMHATHTLIVYAQTHIDTDRRELAITHKYVRCHGCRFFGGMKFRVFGRHLYTVGTSPFQHTHTHTRLSQRNAKRVCVRARRYDIATGVGQKGRIEYERANLNPRSEDR